jgi:hypothetical protein
MIRATILAGRAQNGYDWLKEIGPYFGLDHRRLHLRPELIDVWDGDWCPLSHSDTEGPVDGSRNNHFYGICQRLKNGREVPGTGKVLSIEDIDTFAINNGFGFGYEPGNGRWRYCVYDFITRAGSQRDYDALTQAWRDLITAERLKATVLADDVTIPASAQGY